MKSNTIVKYEIEILNRCLIFSLSVIILTFLFICSANAQAEKTDADLLNKKIDNGVSQNSSEKLSVKDFIEKIFQRSDVSAGIIWAKNENVYDDFPQDLPETNIVEAINVFILEKPAYTWREINGVINIFPAFDEYSILDIRISEFKFENEFPWKMDEYLLKTKEFQEYLKNNNLVSKVPQKRSGIVAESIPDSEDKFGFLYIGPIGRTNPRAKRSINLKNATVREILNEIILLREYGIWSYREYDLISNGNVYRIYRLEL